MKTIDWKLIKNFILDNFKNDPEFVFNNEGKIELEGQKINKSFMAMNKYLYFVQLSLYLMYGKNVLDTSFKAYKNGSYVMGFEDTEMLSGSSKSYDEIDSDVKEIVIKTINCLKQYSVEDLIEMNHSDVVWINSFKKDGNINFENYDDKFKKYQIYKQYLNNIGLPIKDSIISEKNNLFIENLKS